MWIRATLLALLAGPWSVSSAQVADPASDRLSGRGVALVLRPYPDYVPTGGCPRFFQLQLESTAPEEAAAVWIVFKAPVGWTFSPNRWMQRLRPGETLTVPVSASFASRVSGMREPAELPISLHASVDRFVLEGAAEIVIRVPPEHLLGERLCH